MGLLCNEKGVPVSIQVFDGNTNDTQTFKDQADKVATRFNAKSVILVGDGGMIKAPQIAELDPLGFHYITSMGKRQIQSLIHHGLFQLSLFDNELCEVMNEGVRYILRRNPQRMAQIRENREEKLAYVKDLIDKTNAYLKEHKKAQIETYLPKLEAKLVYSHRT